jgi:hypothetical protein
VYAETLLCETLISRRALSAIRDWAADSFAVGKPTLEASNNRRLACLCLGSYLQPPTPARGVAVERRNSMAESRPERADFRTAAARQVAFVHALDNCPNFNSIRSFSRQAQKTGHVQVR